MLGVRVQPWALRYFAFSLMSLTAALVLMALGLTYPVLPLFAPTTLVAVHLVTIGWLTVLMLGALHQFVPVITKHQLANDRLPALTFWFVVVGLCLMVTGFLALPSGPLDRVTWITSLFLPVGGSVIIAGLAVCLANLYLTLARSRPLSLSARYVAVSLGFLALTVLMGTTLALGVTGAGVLPVSILAPILGSGLPFHLLGGIGGWFTLTAMGVALKLLSMFTLAPEDRGAIGEVIFSFLSGGFAVAWLGGMAHVFWPAPALQVVGEIGWWAQGIGVALFLVDMVRMYRARRRRKLELNARFATWSFALLGMALVGFGLLHAAHLGSRAYATWVFLALFGWLTGFALSQLYKIVPFLTWIERYGSRMGRERVPLVQDLVHEKRADPWFRAYFVFATLAAVSVAACSTVLFRASMTCVLLSVLLIGWELLQSRLTPVVRDQGKAAGSVVPAQTRQSGQAGRSAEPVR